MSHAEMQRWRSFFEASTEDIWTLIHRAIIEAALDYPKEFRRQRDRIGEILFDRRLVQDRADDDADDCEEGEFRKISPSFKCTTPNVAGWSEQHEVVRGDGDIRSCGKLNDDAQALSDELEEENHILGDLNSMKEALQDGDQPESNILELLQRLKYMPITVKHLKVTEFGKLVRSLKKHPSKRVQSVARELMKQWKALIDEWIDSEKHANTETVAGPSGDYGCLQNDICAGRSLPPPLDEGAPFAASDPANASQVKPLLISFVDGSRGISTERTTHQLPSDAFGLSVKDNLSYSCRSQSGSVLTDCSELDPKSSNCCPLAIATTVEERGSATRDMHFPASRVKRERTGTEEEKYCGKSQGSHTQALKSTANHSCPGRNAAVTKVKANVVLVRTKPAVDAVIMDGSKMNMHANSVDRACTKVKSTVDDKSIRWNCSTTHMGDLDKMSSQKSHNDETSHKIENVKQKLHQGYEQAVNAKKQRTVQAMGSTELLHSSHAKEVKQNAFVHGIHLSNNGMGGTEKTNTPVQSKGVMHSRGAGQAGKAKKFVPV
ncbi:hypothetical protein KP509_22G058100 [Ceratopteris richardii]|uniref:TFIIS N-terminal domain-containing protein n=1 Tax=Ceratopteris richardii TaxID=49495 RepID=A0A8T2S5J8_CERRI|nr:hypothetical protein KP509_22G058100 [Ceratopteris richardii]